VWSKTKTKKRAEKRALTKNLKWSENQKRDDLAKKKVQVNAKPR
jgi:hypothetical protein